jgi:hypothetical protein
MTSRVPHFPAKSGKGGATQLLWGGIREVNGWEKRLRTLASRRIALGDSMRKWNRGSSESSAETYANRSQNPILTSQNGHRFPGLMGSIEPLLAKTATSGATPLRCATRSEIFHPTKPRRVGHSRDAFFMDENSRISTRRLVRFGALEMTTRSGYFGAAQGPGPFKSSMLQSCAPPDGRSTSTPSRQEQACRGPGGRPHANNQIPRSHTNLGEGLGTRAPLFR